MSDQYQDKTNRILTAVEHKEPDHVPILANIGTWVFAHADKSVSDVEQNPELEIDIYKKPYETIYADITLTVGLLFDSITNGSIGSKMHFVSEDGRTIQHKDITTMNDDEYPQLIEDPMKFIYDVLVPRKASKLQNYPESYNAVKEFLQHWLMKMPIQQRLIEELKTDCQMPVLTGTQIQPPMDLIFDYFRGFKGTAVDMRRRPDLLEQAVDALYPYCESMLGIAPGTESVPPMPAYFTMMHAPTFINPKQFGRFFWPTYKKQLDIVHSLGGKVMINMEGKWENKYEFINDMPKDFAICMVEGDDIFEAKKLIGDNVTIAGGMPISMLKYNTKEECIDYAKKLIDECAPGGGYMFTTDRHFITGADVNTENVIAVHDFVHNYQ